MNQNQLIIITGATASGKTAVSVALAKQLNCEIVSCDSRQLYKEMFIGTAKPSLEEQQGITHHFIGSHTIHNPMTVGSYEIACDLLLKELFKKSNYVILIGGTGQYIDAVISGFDPLPFSETLRNELNLRLKQEGISTLQKELQIADPIAFKSLDINNPQRIIRALEINILTNKNLHENYTKPAKKLDFEVKIFEISLNRTHLYERINQRVLEMIKRGLEDEARKLHKFKQLIPLKTVGYREFFDYFEEKINFTTCVELIQQNSRNYAKRQITWFKKYDNRCILNELNILNARNQILKILKIKNN